MTLIVAPMTVLAPYPICLNLYNFLALIMLNSHPLTPIIWYASSGSMLTPITIDLCYLPKGGTHPLACIHIFPLVSTFY